MKERAAKAINTLGVHISPDMLVNEMPVGYKQFIEIAREIDRKNTRLLFLDEPTVGQDYDNLLNMINIINEFRNKYKTTIITISHDIRCANSLCDKCIILDNKLKIGNKELIDEFFRR